MSKKTSERRNASLLEGLVEVGFFRPSCFPEGYSHEELLDRARAATESDIRVLADGWYVVADPDSVAVMALRRIAGAVEELQLGPVPVSDVIEAIWKEIGYGPRDVGTTKIRREIGKTWAGSYDTPVSKLLLSELCAVAGVVCDVNRGMVDFSTCAAPLEPSAAEGEILSVLDFNMHQALTVGYIVHLCATRRSRTATLDIIYGMPFVLKGNPRNGEYRLIGGSGTPDEYVETVRTFQGATRSADGRRIMLEWKVSYETVEANSFNIGNFYRDELHGTFTDVMSGIEIEYDKDGSDARKIRGIGMIVRDHFPGFLPKMSGFVIFDLDTREARTEVVSVHATDRRKAVMDMLEQGIWRGPLLQDPALAA